MIAWNLKFSLQCKEAVDKINRMSGFINIIFSFKNKEVPYFTAYKTMNLGRGILILERKF